MIRRQSKTPEHLRAYFFFALNIIKVIGVALSMLKGPKSKFSRLS